MASMTRTAKLQPPNRPSLHPRNGILGVIQSRVGIRGSLASTMGEMANARMALALRFDHPQALQIALLQAHRRHRTTAH
jgi:hypothetical protein